MGASVAVLGILLLAMSRGTDASLANSAPVWMCFNLAVFSSAVMLVCRWYILADAGSAWIAAVLLCLGIYLQPLLAVDSAAWSAPLSVSDLVAMAAIVWMLRSGARRVPPTTWRNPVLGGIGIGLALAGSRALWHAVGPGFPDWATFAIIASTFPVAAALASTAALDTEGIPYTRRWVLVILSTVGVFLYHVLPNAPLPPPVADGAVPIAVIACGSFLVVVSFHLLQEAYLTHARRLVALSDRASSAESAAHRGEELIHEFRATVAGIDSATRLLLLSSTRLPPERRTSLQRMLEAELGRLEQMMAEDAASVAGIEPVDLDQVLEPLVVAQRTQGADIDVPACGLTVRGCALELSKAIHVLLCNARQHAPGARIWIGFEVREDTVVIRVRDNGPGISEEIRPSLFDRRAKSSRSDGEGLGLFSARQSMLRQGGDLILEPTTEGGSFALVLPC